MTGTSSRTATAAPRGAVGRKPYAKLRPEEHESPRGVERGVRGPTYPKPDGHPDSLDVEAAGGWSEGHVPYPGRPAYGQESAEAVVARRVAGRRAEHKETDRHVAFAV